MAMTGAASALSAAAESGGHLMIANKIIKQGGAELCQAQVKLEVIFEIVLEVGFKVGVKVEV